MLGKKRGLPRKVAVGFNEWMRRYTEEPAAFEAEFRTVKRFLQEKGSGRTPTYGERSKAYLEKLMAELG